MYIMHGYSHLFLREVLFVPYLEFFALTIECHEGEQWE